MTRAQEQNPLSEMHDYSTDDVYRESVQFLVEVFETMQKNYYRPVDPIEFKKFVYLFNTRLYPRMKQAGQSQAYIKWRSAAYLVDHLRQSNDIFSKFFPPRDAQKYETEVLGKRIDLGIEGRRSDEGWRVDRVEPRSDAWARGLRAGDILVRIDDAPVIVLSDEEMKDRLMPPEGATVYLHYTEHATGLQKTIAVLSQEYFKQFAWMADTGVDGVFCIRIERFNRMTGEDVTGLMETVLNYPGPTGLVIDLRGNPGGPPLAAREISAFFLEPKQEFAYFERRNRPKATLDVPAIPDQYHYKGEIVILVDQDSGSASELFSGVLQHRGRAVLMGENSAGQVFLKSMFYLSDESMLVLVTARGHHPDGTVFSFQGLDPNLRASGDQAGLVHAAAEYLSGRLVRP